VKVVAKQIPEPDEESVARRSAGAATSPGTDDVGHCDACSAPLDLSLYARCDVCEGSRFCLSCARSHVCTAQCLERGCFPGRCVRVIRAGQVSEQYGVDAAPW